VLTHYIIPFRVCLPKYRPKYTLKGAINLEKQRIDPIRYSMCLDLIRLVKAKRKELNLTQEDLADRAGVGLRFIREMEQGKKTLRLDKVNQVLALFGYKMTPGRVADEKS